MYYSGKLNRSEIIQSFREEHPVKHSLMLQFGDCTIKVSANRHDITDALSDYFAGFVTDERQCQVEITVHEAAPPSFDANYTVKTPDPGKTKIKEEFINLDQGRIVRKRLTNMVFVFGENENLAIGPCLENMNQVVNFINNRFIEWDLCKGSLLGHAAAVLWKGRGIAMAGFSGAGKSTLALHLMSKGTDFISNDRLMINVENNELVMRGVAKLPRINPGTILNNENLIGILSESEKEEFAALPPDKLWQLEHKFDVPVDECFSNSRFLLKAPMAMLVILNWQRSEGNTEIKQVDLSDRRDLLPAFMKSTGLFFLPHTFSRINEAGEDDYLAMLQHCRVIEISGAIDFSQAAEACLSFIETGH
jgi:HprK-related kinase B